MRSLILSLGTLLLAASTAAAQVSSGTLTVNNQEMS